MQAVGTDDHIAGDWGRLTRDVHIHGCVAFFNRGHEHTRPHRIGIDACQERRVQRGAMHHVSALPDAPEYPTEVDFCELLTGP